MLVTLHARAVALAQPKRAVEYRTVTALSDGVYLIYTTYGYYLPFNPGVFRTARARLNIANTNMY